MKQILGKKDVTIPVENQRNKCRTTKEFHSKSLVNMVHWQTIHFTVMNQSRSLSSTETFIYLFILVADNGLHMCNPF